MEYALEGHGYNWSRVLRDHPSYRSQPPEARAHLDAQIDDLAQSRATTGVSADRIEAPAELLASLHVRAPSSPRAALALEVATAVKSVFDGLTRARELRITHCTFDPGAPDGFHDLRHWFVTELFRGGGSAPAVQALAGHLHLSTTERYAHMIQSDLRATVALLDRRGNSGETAARPCSARLESKNRP